MPDPDQISPESAAPKWKRVRAAIEQEIEEGHLAPGDRLATEPELAARYGVGRHSVRRAIAELARQGTLRAEQGRGTFVEAAPLIAYAIGQRTRMRQNLAAQGLSRSGETLSEEIRPARWRVARALGLEEGAPVWRTERLSRADGLPLAVGAIYHCAARFPDMAARRAAHAGLTETYASYGITDYLRAETTLHSRLARPLEAERLQQHPDIPVLVLRATDALPDGTPISFSQAVWAATRVQFSITLPEMPHE